MSDLADRIETHERNLNNGFTMTCEIGRDMQEAAARIRELEAENAALREARGVRVKPLVWEDWSAKHRTNNTADTPFGRYGVMQFYFPDMHFKIEPPTGKPFISDTLDAAKSAAQADYARRILSAIDPDALIAAGVREGLRMGADKAAIHNLGRNKARSDRQVASIRALSTSPEAIAAAVARVKGGE